MRELSLIGAAIVLTFTAGTTLAAPCSTGSTKPKDPTPQHVNPKSSDVDKEAKNLSGGQQPGSPGTVGAMDNVGANQKLGEKPGSEEKINQGRGVGTSSKNLAGGQQSAYPGTIGALDNAGANQMLGKKGQQGGC